MNRKSGRIKGLPLNGGLNVINDVTQVSSEILIVLCTWHSFYRMCAKKSCKMNTSVWFGVGVLSWVVRVFIWWGLGPVVWGPLGFLGWGSLYKHKRITLWKEIVHSVSCSIVLLIVFLCSPSGNWSKSAVVCDHLHLIRLCIEMVLLFCKRASHDR